ncbi:MFS transporter [Amycolatopsis methanolica]|uniref:MFS transporter n=1 Tax=Amycolatopsis methanolica TaxID=1814 RepID=UPI00343DD409
MVTTTHRLPARIGALTIATFAVGTDAFVVNGVLPELARSLDVSVGEAGQLVSVFAIAYAVLSPVLAAPTGNWPRRTVLLAALGVFVLDNSITALAPDYGLALASRVIAAAGAAAVTPTASTAAAALAPPERRGRANPVRGGGNRTVHRGHRAEGLVRRHDEAPRIVRPHPYRPPHAHPLHPRRQAAGEVNPEQAADRCRRAVCSRSTRRAAGS